MAKRASTRRRPRKDRTLSLTEKAPKKKPPKRSALTTITTHKARAGWFNAREAWPMREAPVAMLMRARTFAHVGVPSLPTNATWKQAGPVNIGGRTTAIASDPNDPMRLWVGSAGGGVWFSNDAGFTWAPQWHSEPILNIGSLCLDPHDANTIYCGTGEANLSADSHAGVGIYRTLDGGKNWHLLAAAHAMHLPKRIGRIAVDPFNSNHIFAAGVGHRNDDARGLFRSTDGGMTWALVSTIFAAPYHAHDVVFHPITPGIVYATVDTNGAASGIWRSKDSGATWTHLTSGLPISSHVARVRVAIAPSSPKVIYAQFAARHPDGVLGIFRSVNGGDTWQSIGGNHFAAERQMTYNNAISVDPFDADTVVCGGVDLHRTRNGGNTWKRITDWRVQRNVDPDYAHADQHDLYHHPARQGLLYAVNDGGLDVSEDGGSTWRNRSTGMATNMFYDLNVAAANGNMFGGGMQDNGTWLTLDGNPDKFVEITGGDGGFCTIDSIDPLHLYTSSQFMTVYRHRRTDGWTFDIGPNETGPRPWMAVIAMDPVNPKRVFVGSWRVWRSLNDGGSWQDVSGDLDGSFITCIEVSRADTKRIYVGTENGGIFRSADGGNAWTGNIASSALPGRTITRLCTPANNADIVYATVANFGSSHLFRTTDGGTSWQDVDGGNLPDAPHHGIAIPAQNPDAIFVAGDTGVLVSFDGTSTWNNLTLNLPTVPVVDIVLHETTRTLFAATYGRSTWRLDLSGL